MDLNELWKKIRKDACQFWTKGQHDYKDVGEHLKCRICGNKIPDPSYIPPQPEPQPDPVPDVPDPTPNEGEPLPSNAAAYRAGFLWKPVAESDGKLIVLSPEGFTGHIDKCWLEFDGESFEVGSGVGVYNGNRWHTRFSKVGGAYKSGTTFALRTDSGRVWLWKVTNTGSRNDGNITPTVRQ